MAKRKAETDRRRRIEEIKRKEKRSERRRTLAIVLVSVLVAFALIGGAVYASSHRDTRTAAEKAAGCLKEKRSSGLARGHVDTPVTYPQAPPAGGNHNPDPLPQTPQFYRRDAAPPPERAVHSLEHGWVIAWYDTQLSQGQIDELSKVAIGPNANGRKFIGLPWQRSVFQKDRHVVLTSWEVTMRCKSISADVVSDFLGKHENKAPEPDGGGGSAILPSPTPKPSTSAKPGATPSAKPSGSTTPTPPPTPTG